MMIENVVAMALGDFDRQGKFLMFCVDCSERIPGTVSYDILRVALMNNAGRGGVKCPDCRRQSCYLCGVRSAYSEVVEVSEDGELALPRVVCPICLLEYKYYLSSYTISQKTSEGVESANNQESK